VTKKAKTCAHKGCKAPSNFIKDNGFCHAHGPGAKERLQLMGMRGGETMRRRWAGGALLPNELPPLVDHESAKKWLEILGRAVASKKLPAQEGREGRGRRTTRRFALARLPEEVGDREEAPAGRGCRECRWLEDTRYNEALVSARGCRDDVHSRH